MFKIESPEKYSDDLVIHIFDMLEQGMTEGYYPHWKLTQDAVDLKPDLIRAEKTLRDAGERLQMVHALLGKELIREADSIKRVL